MSGKDHGGDRKRDDAGALDAAAGGKDAPVRKEPVRKEPVRKDKSSPVGRALRTVYDDMLRETVPDDFLDLLKRLD